MPAGADVRSDALPLRLVVGPPAVFL
jgi:hypothetical protein